MENVVETEMTAEKKADFIKQCNEYFAAIGQILAQIDKDEAEVERLNAETRGMLAGLRQVV